VIRTDGANGLAWWAGRPRAGSDGRPFKLKVVDHTGAGEPSWPLLHRPRAVDPRLLTAAENTRQSRWGAAAAMRFGAVPAGPWSARGRGADRAQPSAAEVRTFLQQFSCRQQRSYQRSAGRDSGMAACRLLNSSHRPGPARRSGSGVGPFHRQQGTRRLGFFPLPGRNNHRRKRHLLRRVRGQMDEMADTALADGPLC